MENRQKYLYTETYGCQMNLIDSELITGCFSKAGYQLTEDKEKADVILVNTCAVREHAEQRVFGRLGELQALKLKNPNLVLGVVGCMAQHLGEKIMEKSPYIDLVAGPDNYRKLPELIERRHDETIVELSFDPQEDYSDIEPVRQNSLRAWVAISRGCNNTCTYCVVPHTRGPLKHQPYWEILNAIRRLSSKGFKEVTLLGQNVNSYSYNGVDFPELLKLVNDETDIPRIRFITSHPADCSDRLLETMARCKKICEHLHLPMQAGSANVLEAMGRGYSAEHYACLVEKARKIIPDLSLTTDIIVGFPGETEQDFYKTLDLLEQIRFDSAFTYKYSPRNGTLACKMRDTLSEEVKGKRLEKLIAVQRQISAEINSSMIGSEVEVLIEKPSRRDVNELQARTRTDKPVILKRTNGNKKPGDIVIVKLVDSTGSTLIGELIG